ncbi:hypothetical protein IMZ31_12205 [Pontibacillus sp. ALD_SL1]|uniref:hypothetical protein n=1 Tax=Pontibacillus sp. ALD_SL1 TaxID=2777185 RepID=UPI001A96A5F1|nr:hypothetical protein [Pontibacillus sp. ALD_SL1]QSS98861.1 hypothetical protein IMZ31_12205 [Pontibacillus sp. ALD_SL1]
MKHFLVGLIVYLGLVIMPTQALATSWAYPFVVWDNSLYIVTDQEVTDVGERIGQVTRYSDMEQYGGNFSNVYEKGTNYYAIKGIPTYQSIAVKEKSGRFVKADWEKEYTYGSAFPVGLVSMVAVLIVIGMILIYFTRRSSLRQ